MNREVTLEKILKYEDCWYMENVNYHMDKDWLLTEENPSIYPAFEWREKYTFRTTLYYFHIVLRRHTNGTILRNMVKDKHESKSRRYSVVIGVAFSGGDPLPLELWEETGDPWKGFNQYSYSYYFGEFYKDKFEFDDPSERNEVGSPSFLGKYFEDINEARNFINKWKNILIEDHKEHFEIEKQLLSLLKTKNYIESKATF